MAVTLRAFRVEGFFLGGGGGVTCGLAEATRVIGWQPSTLYAVLSRKVSSTEKQRGCGWGGLWGSNTQYNTILHPALGANSQKQNTNSTLNCMSTTEGEGGGERERERE